jgi:hypothetical protein
MGERAHEHSVARERGPDARLFRLGANPQEAIVYATEPEPGDELDLIDCRSGATQVMEQRPIGRSKSQVARISHVPGHDCISAERFR